MFSTAGCTDSKCLDEQAATEATQSIMLAVLSGANLIHDVGFIESGMTGSLVQLVMNDEIIGMARQIARGIQVDNETLAVDAIAQAVSAGDFLSLDHTAKHFRQQFWFPDLMDRQRHGEWVIGGKQSMGDRVRERVSTILRKHRTQRLRVDVTKRLDEILER